jgi:hypothetical protein
MKQQKQDEVMKNNITSIKDEVSALNATHQQMLILMKTSMKKQEDLEILKLLKTKYKAIHSIDKDEANALKIRIAKKSDDILNYIINKDNNDITINDTIITPVVMKNGADNIFHVDDNMIDDVHIIETPLAKKHAVNNIIILNDDTTITGNANNNTIKLNNDTIITGNDDTMVPSGIILNNENDIYHYDANDNMENINPNLGGNVDHYNNQEIPVDDMNKKMMDSNNIICELKKRFYELNNTIQSLEQK